MLIGGISVVTVVLFLVSCLPLSHAYFWSQQSSNATLLRFKRQNCGFTCNNGDCISTDNVCDGTTECADGSDETPTQCSTVTCPPFLFRCAYGACINANKVCNNVKDCADNSDETQPKCPSSGMLSCSPSEFRCDSGQCIDSFLLCDGRKDCTDGSDETKAKCGNLICAPFLFKCSYGPCIDSKAKCNGVEDCADGSDEIDCGGDRVTVKPPPVITPTTSSVPIDGGCLLPNHPPNGRRLLPNLATYIPNTSVPQSTAIQLECNNGYKAIDLFQGGTSYCFGGKWVGEDISEDVCKKTCSPLDDPSIVAQCYLNNNIINCQDAVEGVTALTTCTDFFKYGTSRPRMICRNGQWLPNLGSCVPECGIKRVNAQALIIGGLPTVPGEYPWIVAIYRNSEHICGGSIISRRYIVSAAHCFTDPNTGKAFDKNEYTVMAGKYYRAINDSRDSETHQLRKILDLKIHEDYRGRKRNYQNDIALLHVDDFNLNLNVQPVCVDWSQQYEEISLREGNTGVIGGWGFTEEGGNPAEELKKLLVPIRNKVTCEKDLPQDFFDTFYTSDKICAGYVNNATNVCSGDSGGGFFFQSDRLYYIRGIVSLAPTSEVGCNKNLYALYTKVSQFHDWLSQITGKFV